MSQWAPRLHFQNVVPPGLANHSETLLKVEHFCCYVIFMPVRVTERWKWHGMWHDLRNGIIMPSIILERLFDINYTKKRGNFLRQAILLNSAGSNMMKIN